MKTVHMDSAELINSHEWVYVLDDVMQTQSEGIDYLQSLGFTEWEAIDYLFALIATEQVRILRAKSKRYVDVPFNLAKVMALACA
jgi:hypothetical protein